MISMAGSFNNKTVYLPLEGSLNNKILCILLVLSIKPIENDFFGF
jgi:hypothetical protein